jgi:hypothetical protein
MHGATPPRWPRPFRVPYCWGRISRCHPYPSKGSGSAGLGPFVRAERDSWVERAASGFGGTFLVDVGFLSESREVMPMRREDLDRALESE